MDINELFSKKIKKFQKTQKIFFIPMVLFTVLTVGFFFSLVHKPSYEFVESSPTLLMITYCVLFTLTIVLFCCFFGIFWGANRYEREIKSFLLPIQDFLKIDNDEFSNKISVKHKLDNEIAKISFTHKEEHTIYFNLYFDLKNNKITRENSSTDVSFYFNELTEPILNILRVKMEEYIYNCEVGFYYLEPYKNQIVLKKIHEGFHKVNNLTSKVEFLNEEDKYYVLEKSKKQLNELKELFNYLSKEKKKEEQETFLNKIETILSKLNEIEGKIDQICIRKTKNLQV